jgi:hypothetical protein
MKHLTEGKKEGRIAVAGRRERRNKMVSKTWGTLGNVTGRTRSHSGDESLWKKLCTCRKTEKNLNEVIFKLLLKIGEYTLKI